MCALKIALTGGIATGKSTVARMFERLGAVILDADKAARDVVRPGTECWNNLRKLLGEDYFDPDGQLRRRKTRDLIVRDPEVRSKVNSLLHPAVLSSMEAAWEAVLRRQRDCPVIFDIPLLFEIGAASAFDLIILVYSPREIQIERLMTRDGVSREEAENTLLIQLPIETKKCSAHIVIDNSRDLDSTEVQVLAAWARLRRALSAHQGSL